jgi:hypothetical protein
MPPPPPALFQDPLPLPGVAAGAVLADGTISYRLEIRRGAARFHRDLPEAEVWGYESLLHKWTGRSRGPSNPAFSRPDKTEGNPVLASD